jgi:hypothetical protein
VDVREHPGGTRYGIWGFLLGCMPAAILGIIAGALWPMAILGGIILLIGINWH